MITHHCDVCNKTSELQTNEVNGFRAVPLGWFFRTGRVQDPKSDAFLEIRVVCCSQKCCKAYDKVEAKKVGFHWGKFIIEMDGDATNPTEQVKPLRVT